MELWQNTYQSNLRFRVLVQPGAVPSSLVNVHHNETQPNDIQHTKTELNDTQHNDTQHNDI